MSCPADVLRREDESVVDNIEPGNDQSASSKQHKTGADDREKIEEGENRFAATRIIDHQGGERRISDDLTVGEVGEVGETVDGDSRGNAEQVDENAEKSDGNYRWQVESWGGELDQ